MFITLLYVSAFMFFLADRKARLSYLAGIAVTFLASIPFSWRTLFGGYETLRFARQFIPDIDEYNKNILCIVCAVFVSLIITAVFMALAKMWSRDLFLIPRDEIKSRKMVKRLFIAASLIPGIVAVWLFAYKAVFFGTDKTRGIPYYLLLFDNIGIDFFFIKPERYGSQREIHELMRIANSVYVALLLAISILCIILISRKKFRYKDLPSSVRGTVSALPAAAITISLGGITAFLTVAQRGYIYWSSNFRFITTIVPIYYSLIFGSYDKVSGKFGDQVRFAFCMFVFGVMAAGIILLLISMIYMAVRKKIRQNLFSFLFSIALIIISSGCIYRMLTEMEKFYSIRR
ncbi:MAG: hypothetical protein K5779_06435 [Saccharofermentans sp.]|nr:hypothetical protein [Saccharofermentans sp.]